MESFETDTQQFYSPSNPCALYDAYFKFESDKNPLIVGIDKSSYTLKTSQLSRESRLISGNFPKQAEFAKDGLVFLTSCEDNSLKLYDIPFNAFNHSYNENLPEECKPVVTMHEGESIHGFDWFPMTSTDSRFFVTATRDHPLHLWSTKQSKVVAQYKLKNHADEVAGAIAVCCLPDATAILACREHFVHIFDTQRPGEAFEVRPTTASRKSPYGQKGLLSCLDASPDSNMYAVGSYSRSIYVYDQVSGDALGELPQLHTGGITQLQFSPCGMHLYSGARRDKHVLCWDLRNLIEPVHSFERATSDTNQRIGFDIDGSGSFLVTGQQKDSMLVYDTRNGTFVNSIQMSTSCVNGASFHPNGIVMLASFGERDFSGLFDESDTSSDEENTSSRQRIQPNPDKSGIAILRTAYRYENNPQIRSSNENIHTDDQRGNEKGVVHVDTTEELGTNDVN